MTHINLFHVALTVSALWLAEFRNASLYGQYLNRPAIAESPLQPDASWAAANSPMEVSADRLPHLGSGDFTLSAWVKSDADSGQVSGDLISHYDPSSRRGFHLTLKSNPGVTSNQANWRHLQFGIDDDRWLPWQDCGRPGNALFAFSMAVHAGELYAGTCEPAALDSGRVYRLASEKTWQDCGSLDGSNSVTSMAVFQDSLYAGTGKYRVAGSALPESENDTLGGRVFRYLGGMQWEDCGQLPGVEAVGGLTVYRGRLYASSLYKPAGFFRYEGSGQWTSLPVPTGSELDVQVKSPGELAAKRVVSLTVYDGFLFATSYDCGNVYRFDGESWTDCGLVGENTQTYAFVSYRGRLHVATWPSGRVFRFDDVGQWTDVGRLGEELEVMGMIVHNGRLLAGTLPSAQVYSYEEKSDWQLVAQLDQTPDVRYRRAWTMAEHAGRLYCSTLPSGSIHACAQGSQVAWGHSLSSEWHHVAAVKSSDRLSLWLDGRCVSQSQPFDASSYNVSSPAAWRLADGMNGPLHGQLSDIRVYRQALSQEQIAQLALMRP